MVWMLKSIVRLAFVTSVQCTPPLLPPVRRWGQQTAKQSSQVINERPHICNTYPDDPGVHRAKHGVPAQDRLAYFVHIVQHPAELHCTEVSADGKACLPLDRERREQDTQTGSLNVKHTHGCSSSVCRPSGGSCPFLELCWWGSPLWIVCAGPTKLQNWSSSNIRKIKKTVRSVSSVCQNVSTATAGGNNATVSTSIMSYRSVWRKQQASSSASDGICYSRCSKLHKHLLPAITSEWAATNSAGLELLPGFFNLMV